MTRSTHKTPRIPPSAVPIAPTGPIRALEPEGPAVSPIARRWLAGPLLACLLFSVPARSVELQLIPAPPPAAAGVPAPMFRDQLPHSRVATGQRDIVRAYLAEPTDRYPHGALGDRQEASSLVVILRDETTLRLELPGHRVFEDLVPRLVDLDGDGRDEILVVESDSRLGASLAIYGLREVKMDRRLMLLSRSPFIGTAFRWLNPLGVGDFDGDGQLDIALVVTPHIHGVLQLYRYTAGTLSLMAEIDNVSTHRLGSTELAMGVVLPQGAAAAKQTQRPGDWILAPNQSHRQLRLLALSGDRLIELQRINLGGTLSGALQLESGEGQPLRVRVRLNEGRGAQILLKP